MNDLTLESARQGVFGKHPDGNTTITFRRLLKHPVEKVWRAITEQDELAAWLPMLRKMELSEGGEVVLDFSGGDCPPNELNPADVDYCRITRLEPPHLLEYLGPTGGLRFELSAAGDQTELVFTAINHPQQGILYSVVCGWHYYTEVLEWHLDSTPFEIEGYMGPTLMRIYQYYRDEKIPGFDG